MFVIFPGTALLKLAVFGLGFGSSSRLNTRARRVLFPIILLSASIVLMLIALEWTARFVYRDVRSATDTRTYMGRRAVSQRTNSLGFRDPDIPPKQTGQYRIVAIGDSITWGQGVEEGERFSNLLQHDLGNGYEVINFALPGHDMPEHLRKLQHALTFEPDFVLLQLYINDFETRLMHRPVPHALVPWPTLHRRLLASSILYAMMGEQWQGFQERMHWVESYREYMQRHLGNPDSQDSRLSFGMLHDFLQRAAAAGTPAGVVIFPNPNLLGRGYPYAFLHNRMREVCYQEHIEFVDLEPVFATMGDPRGLWASRFDQHPNARAHRRAEEELLAKFGPVWRAGRPQLANHPSDR
jgi:lysophospholipase L1-like esterase